MYRLEAGGKKKETISKTVGKSGPAQFEPIVSELAITRYCWKPNESGIESSNWYFVGCRLASVYTRWCQMHAGSTMGFNRP